MPLDKNAEIKQPDQDKKVGGDKVPNTMTPASAIRLDLGDFGEREEFEAKSRGYLNTAFVLLPDGRRIPVTFYDSIRLAQDLDSEKDRGRHFIAEPGMIILEEVTRANMEDAVKRLAEEGFFDHFRPVK